MNFLLDRDHFEDEGRMTIRLPLSDEEENILLLMKMLDTVTDKDKHKMIATLINALKVDWSTFRDYYDLTWYKK
jgi:hypothetical protein